MTDNSIILAIYDNTNKIVDTAMFSSEDEELRQQVLSLKEPGLQSIFCFDGTAVVEGYYFNNKFYPPKAYQSWIADPETNNWIPPVEKPDAGFWEWNEETISWIELNTAIEE